MTDSFVDTGLSPEEALKLWAPPEMLAQRHGSGSPRPVGASETQSTLTRSRVPAQYYYPPPGLAVPGEPGPVRRTTTGPGPNGGAVSSPGTAYPGFNVASQSAMDDDEDCDLVIPDDHIAAQVALAVVEGKEKC
jgi:hypothetical protein